MKRVICILLALALLTAPVLASPPINPDWIVNFDGMRYDQINEENSRYEVGISSFLGFTYKVYVYAGHAISKGDCIELEVSKTFSFSKGYLYVPQTPDHVMHIGKVLTKKVNGDNFCYTGEGGWVFTNIRNR